MKTKSIKTNSKNLLQDKKWNVQILIKCKKYKISKTRIKKIAQAVLTATHFKKITASTNEISIVLTNDKEIHKLNRDYRDKDKPTDVLSFSQLENSESNIPSPTLGDVVISLETAIVQAKKYRTTVDREIIRLLVHGILHLLGYDHEGVSKATATRMFSKQKNLCALIEKAKL